MKAPKITLSQIGYIPIFILLFSFLNINAQQIAFPSAKGAGAYSTGGRGGQVIHVTTLNWDGPGSLKEAIKTKGPRTIVFDVSGEIDATSQGNYEDLIVGSDYDNITIAGQTAPHGGITIRTSFIIFRDVDNVVVRYIRFRNTNKYSSSDPIWNQGGSNIIFDHCTFSHGNDEALDFSYSLGTMGNVTIQNCFLQDSKTGVILGVDSSGNPTPLPDLGDFTFVNNAISNISHRFPNPQGGGQYDIVNNVIYNWKERLIRVTNEGTYNIINNYYKTSAQGLRRSGWFPGTGVITTRLHKLQAQTYNNPLIYTSGSLITGQREVPQVDDSDMWTYFAGSHSSFREGNPVAAKFFTKIQFPFKGVDFTIKTAHQAYIDVLNDVGANKTLNADGTLNEYQDTKDAADILMIQNDSFVSYDKNDFSYPPLSEVPYPTIPRNTRSANFYISNPHIPEIWLKANVPEGQDHNDIAPSGYTWLEEYLNGVDRTGEVAAVAVESVEVTPSTARVQILETLQLSASFTPSNATNKNGTWISSDEDIATVDTKGLVTAVSVGEVTIAFTSADGGIKATSLITVFPEALQASAGTDQEVCVGTTTTLTASGGTNYVWSTGETSESIEVTPETTTTYTVTVSDENDQSEEASVTVTVSAIPTANAGEDQTICNGETTTLTATGGSSYLWSTGETTASIEVNPEVDTVYSVEVSTNGCSSTDEVSVSVKDAPELVITGDLIISEGESTTLTVNGGGNYEWNTGETSESITVSPTVTTTYSVSSISPAGCSSNANITVTVAQQVSANAGQDVAICVGTSTILTATGGSIYQWSNGATTDNIEVSPDATTTYSVTVFDSTGTNSDTDEVTVTVNPLPTVDAGSGSTIDAGESVTLTATGATTYKWSNGATGATINVSPTATRTYTVTGTRNGCEATDKVKVIVRNTVEVIADAGVDQSICAGSSATLTATGGSTYLWSTGATTESISVSPSSTTTYSVTAYDESGQNSDTDEVKVTVNALPAVDAGSNVKINSGESTTLTATGATTYKWSTGSTGSSITVSPTATRTYTVIGTRNGCEVADTVEVTVLNPVEVIADAGVDQSICAGSSATLTATGGSTYLWSTGATTASISVSPSSTTTYSVTAYDSTGKYSHIDEVKVTVNSMPTVSVGKNITITSGESTKLTASGAQSYKWSTGETGASINVSPTSTTTYTVTGTRNGCDAIATVKVIVEKPQVVVARAGGNKDICQGSPVTLTATGGDRYLWSTGAKTASITVNPKTTTKYSVTAYIGEASGTDEATVKVSPKPNVKIVNGSEAAILEGEFITLSAQGANRYEWSNGATQPNIAVRPTKTKTYEVVGYTNDCSSEKSIKVNVFEKIVANAGDDVAICLNGSTVLTAKGPANSEYLWSTGEVTKSITVSPDNDTEYSVMVYHALDSDTDSVMVSVRNCETSQIVDDNVTIEDDTTLELLIHPNPTYGEVHIKISGLSDASSIYLYDLSGKSLYTEAISVNDHQGYNKTIDLSDFASGIYLLQLVDNQRVITKKIVLR
ncbi:Ig-like domain-containing protein [Gelidibacter pelagius]|uniref:Ig-like domain-containing protein n=1 Tax=Gelidibacter pelagius TaxID=2819985 RepID=A0ABS3SR70_9FLAO|nr:Ig-like domain-containing protein [Gelidibacter pelagius]MBO3097921.1 Ig-like domain-containing protein [Gelidibacter pelagius]